MAIEPRVLEQDSITFSSEAWLLLKIVKLFSYVVKYTTAWNTRYCKLKTFSFHLTFPLIGPLICLHYFDTVSLSWEGSFLEAGGQGAPCNHHSVPDPSWRRGSSMLSPIRNTVIVTGGSCLEARGQGAPCNHDSVPDPSWQHGDSMLAPVRNTVILQCCNAAGSVTGRASGL